MVKAERHRGRAWRMGQGELHLEGILLCLLHGSVLHHVFNFLLRLLADALSGTLLPLIDGPTLLVTLGT